MNLQQLSDFYELQMLKAKYFRAMDLRKWDEFREVFTDDFVLYLEPGREPDSSTPPAISGGDALIAYLSACDPGKRTVHQGHMPEIEFQDENHATGVWAMFDWVDDPGRGTVAQGYGHYYETYVRGADGRWRISSTRLTRLRNNLVPPVDTDLPTTLVQSLADSLANSQVRQY